MATIFPGSASVSQEFNGYIYNGVTWDKFFVLEPDFISGYQPKVIGVSSTEIGYLDGVTSFIQTQLDNIQTQLDNKVSHSYYDDAEVFPIKINSQQILSNYTISSEYNAMSSGPIQINSSIYVEVSSGSTWSIV